MYYLIILIFLVLTNFNSILTKSLKRLTHLEKEYPLVKNNILDLSNLKLSSIEGIEKYPSIEQVETLILSDNRLKSIQPLGLLSKYNIRFLYLTSNRITDLKPLKKLKMLQEVYVEGNLIDVQQVKEIIFSLKKLKIFMVDENPIDNIAYKHCAKKYKKINFLEILKYIICKDINDVDMVKPETVDVDDKCAICFSEENLYQIASCKHKFHLGCLDEWIKKCNEAEIIPLCPLCKQLLKS